MQDEAEILRIKNKQQIIHETQAKIQNDLLQNRRKFFRKILKKTVDARIISIKNRNESLFPLEKYAVCGSASSGAHVFIDSSTDIAIKYLENCDSVDVKVKRREGVSTLESFVELKIYSEYLFINTIVALLSPINIIVYI